MTESDWLASKDPAAMLAWLNKVTESAYGYPAERGRKLSPRKLRLFACACARQVWHLFTDERSRRAVEVGEAFADGQASKDELTAACGNALGFASRIDRYDVMGRTPPSKESLTAWLAVWPANDPSLIGMNTDGYLQRNVADKVGAASLLREIVGNPFRPVTLPESEVRCSSCGKANPRTRLERWQCMSCGGGPVEVYPGGWLTPLVVCLATSIYEARDWETMPILGDALEDAGCTDEAILRHLRGQKRCVQCGEDGCLYCTDGWVEDWWLRTDSYTPPLRVRGDWVLDLILGKE